MTKAKATARPASIPLPHGMDDLQAGVDYLLTCAPEWRQGAADKITADITGIKGTAAAELILIVQRFAAFGGDAEPVRAAFVTFTVDAGAWIGARQQGQKLRSAGGKARKILTTAEQRRRLEVITARLEKVPSKPDTGSQVAYLQTVLTEADKVPTSESSLRRLLAMLK